MSAPVTSSRAAARRNVAITGGAGRLGNVLVRAALARGDRVRVLEPTAGPHASLDGLDIELVVGSVLDRERVEAFVDGADVVFHVAAKLDLGRDRDGSIARVNVEGTKNVGEACLVRGIRLVHTSSHAALVRAPLEEPLTEEKPLALEDPCDYHRSKARAEQLLLEMCEDGLDVVVVAPGTMIGPYDFEPSLIGRAILDLVHGKVPMLMEVLSDYVDARDVAEGMLAAADRGRRGERYLLTGHVLSIEAITALLRAMTGCAMPRMVLPLWAGWALLPWTLGYAKLTGRAPIFTAGVLRASVSNEVVLHEKAARELGFHVRPLADALADQLVFAKERGMLRASIELDRIAAEPDVAPSAAAPRRRASNRPRMS